MLCFAGQNVSRKKDGGSLSGGRVRDGVGYVRIMVGWAPHWNCEFRLHFHNLNFQNLREVSHENSVSYLPLSDVEGSLARKLRFHFHSSAFRFWFEGSLALKLRFHTFNFPILREVLHDSFVLTFSTFTFWGKSRAKPSFSYLPLSLFEGSLAWKAFLRDSRCTKCCVLQDRTCLGRRTGKLVRRTGARRSRLCSDHGRSGPALKLRVQAEFSHFEFSKFEGSLARKLRFHICYFHSLREVSHDSFVLTSSTFTFWGKSCTTALFPHLPLSLFEGSLARKLRLHIFIYTSSTLTFWGKSRAKPSFSYLPLSLFEGSLAWKAFLRDSRIRCTKCCVLQDRTCLGRRTGKLVRRTGARRCRLCSDHGRMGPALELRVQASFSQFELSKFEGSLARKLRFVSSTFRCWGKSRTKASFSFWLFDFQIWRKSRTKASLSHLQLSDFEGSLARQLRSHIFHFHFLREVLHDSFVSTSSAFTFWGKSRTTASFPHVPLSDFNLKEVSH